MGEFALHVCLDCEAVRQVRPTPDVPTPADATPSRRPGTQQPPQHVLLWDDEELPSGREGVLLKICFVARSPNRSDHAPSFRLWNAMWPPSNQAASGKNKGGGVKKKKKKKKKKK